MRKLIPVFLIFVLLCGVLPAWNAAARDAGVGRPSDFPVVMVQDLPKEARETLAVIKKGGPFPYAKDGSIFGNRERILPMQKRGYYREFTVKTPASKTRGARRIISGATGEYYYTQDHYASFKRIRE